MKRIMIVIIGMTLMVSACAPVASVPAAPIAAGRSTPEPGTGSAPVPTAAPVGESEGILNTEFEDAANLRNQLAYGTLQLEGTVYAVTPEQAQSLLPLWQAMIALSGDGSAISEELSAVQAQIVETMQPEQLQAIAGLRIRNATLAAFYEEKGIVLPTPAPGVTKVPGGMKNVSTEDKQATRTAREASGTSGAGTGQLTKTLLYEEVVKLLVARAAP